MTQAITTDYIESLFKLPFMDLLYQAHGVHREHFDPQHIQRSTLLSIKTGACPEDCAYCPQSAHYNTELKREKLLDLDYVLDKAKKAKAAGATRFCMGAAWKYPPKKELPKVLEMIKEVKALGLETCATLGTLRDDDADQLQEAGLDYYNHNLDTSRDYYKKIITTRSYDERIDTLGKVRDAGMKVCCGGIIGMGETAKDRVQLLWEFAQLPEAPESIPINHLIPIKGTPLAASEPLNPIEFVRTIAVARILFPKSYVRLSAGRESMSDECQALCFFAGANSIFYGETLLTAPNPAENADNQLLQRLGMHIQPQEETACA